MPNEKDQAKKASQWQFIREASSSWSWRKLLVDGSLDTVSEASYPDYAFAVNDAINHGFRPRRDYWLIATEFGITHFHAGEPPAFVARKEGDIIPPVAQRSGRSGKEAPAPDASSSTKSHSGQ